ncbi:MAG: hypothetical protein H6740_07925, partial [Alphaproteobacteria bacterium]|nr:hypothetical protein [Alphaproteobacteria bacterium]
MKRAWLIGLVSAAAWLPATARLAQAPRLLPMPLLLLGLAAALLGAAAAARACASRAEGALAGANAAVVGWVAGAAPPLLLWAISGFLSPPEGLPGRALLVAAMSYEAAARAALVLLPSGPLLLGLGALAGALGVRRPTRPSPAPHPLTWGVAYAAAMTSSATLLYVAPLLIRMARTFPETQAKGIFVSAPLGDLALVGPDLVALRGPASLLSLCAAAAMVVVGAGSRERLSARGLLGRMAFIALTLLPPALLVLPLAGVGRWTLSAGHALLLAAGFTLGWALPLAQNPRDAELGSRALAIGLPFGALSGLGGLTLWIRA